MYEDLARLVTFRPLERAVPGPSRYSPFKASWTSTVTLLAKELRAHGAQRTVLEVDFRETDLRNDGLPRADRRARTPGIVLSFVASRVAGRPALRYEVGTFTDWRDNVRAVALGLEALRAVDRHGVTKRGEQYAGWKALPSGNGGPDPERGRVLIREHGGEREALMATHPDRGGNADDFADVAGGADMTIEPQQQPGESDEDYGRRLDALRDQQRAKAKADADEKAEPPSVKLRRVGAVD